MNLDPTLGHEQRGVRPCVVVSDPEVVSDQRFSLVGIVPISGTPGHGALYPRLEVGSSGLNKVSFVLIEQIRSIDKRRVRRSFGAVSRTEMDAIDEGLTLFLGLGDKLAGTAP